MSLLKADQPLREAAVGVLHIKKVFPPQKKPYAGTVVKFSADTCWYQVRYEDGDEEELDWSELMGLDPQLSTAEHAKAKAAPQHKPTKPSRVRRGARASQDIGAATAAAGAAAAAAADTSQEAAAAAAAAADRGRADQDQDMRPRKRAKPTPAAEAVAAGSPRVDDAKADADAEKDNTKAVAANGPAAVAAAAAAGTSKPGPKGPRSNSPPAQPAKGKKATRKAPSPAAAAAAADGPDAAGAAAAAAAAADGPSKPKRKSPAAAAAGAAQPKSTSGAAAKKTQQQQQEKEKPNSQTKANAKGKGTNKAAAAPAAPAAAAAAAAAAPKQPRKAVMIPPIIKPLPEHPPAHVLEEAWRAHEDAVLSVEGLMGVRAAALAAEDVVRCGHLSGCDGDDSRPLWLAEPGELPVVHNTEEAVKVLTETAVSIDPSKAPYLQHILVPPAMKVLLEGDDPQAAAEAALKLYEVKAVKSKPKAPTAEEGAKEGQGEGVGSGREKKSSAKGTGKKGKDAAAAAAAPKGGKGGSSKATSSAAAAAAAAAAGGASGKGSSKGRGSKAAGAAGAAAAAAGAGGGDEVVHRRYRLLAVATEQFEDPDNSLASAVMMTCRAYNAELRAGMVSEEARVERIAAENAEARAAGQPVPHPKQPSRRPDRVAESAMSSRLVNARGACGHVPGIRTNAKFELRALASVVGLHKSPMSGMVAVPLPFPLLVDGESHKVSVVASIVVSGVYIPNKDTHADQYTILVYTGMGGCDLNGNKGQIKDQALAGVNAAMLVNIGLGIPLRVLRRNEDPSSSTGSSLIYDGLYNVVSVAVQLVPEGYKPTQGSEDAEGDQDQQQQQQEEEEQGDDEEADQQQQQQAKKKKTAKQQPQKQQQKQQPQGKQAQKQQQQQPQGKQGKEPRMLVTFVFGLRRRAGQPEPLSKPIPHWKGVTSAKAAMCIDHRAHALCRDVSRGAEEPATVPGVNEFSRELPPGVDPVRDQELLMQDGRDSPCIADPSSFTYIRDHTYDSRVSPPKPPKLLLEGSRAAEAAAAAMREAAASGSNDGCGPYVQGPLWNKSAVIVTEEEEGDEVEGPHRLLARLNAGHLPWTSIKDGEKWVAGSLQRVMIECGDWTGCKLGDQCPQRRLPRPLPYRLEVYKTAECGWGVQSWDNIQAGTLVCVMKGRIFRREDVGTSTHHGHSEYVFDLAPRPDVNHRGQDVKRDVPEPRYVLCARDEGNVARFINHSCDANLYVQPVCSGHTDTDHVDIALVAMRNIPAFTPLSYDYGVVYVEDNLDGNCRCGADCCISKRRQQQQGQAGTPAAAAGVGARKK